MLYNLPNKDSVDLAVDSDQCVEEPQDCVNGADLCYPSQHNKHYYSSASPDFGMVLTPDLIHLNPRFSPQPICPETSSEMSSLSRAQQHSVARKLIMSPEDCTFSVFSEISNIDHDVISFTMICIQAYNKRQRLDGYQDVIPAQCQQRHLTSSSTKCVLHGKTNDSPLNSLSLDGDSAKDNTPQSASSPKKNTLPEPEYLHVSSLPKPDTETCQQHVQEIRQHKQDTSKPATIIETSLNIDLISE